MTDEQLSLGNQLVYKIQKYESILDNSINGVCVCKSAPHDYETSFSKVIPDEDLIKDIRNLIQKKLDETKKEFSNL